MSGTFPSTKPTPYTLTVLIVCCEDWMRFYEWSTNEVRNSRTFCPWHDLSDPPKLLVNVYCTCELLFSLVLSWLFHPLAFWISPCSPHQILALKSHFSLSFFSCLLAKVPDGVHRNMRQVDRSVVYLWKPTGSVCLHIISGQGILYQQFNFTWTPPLCFFMGNLLFLSFSISLRNSCWINSPHRIKSESKSISSIGASYNPLCGASSSLPPGMESLAYDRLLGSCLDNKFSNHFYLF